MADLIDRQAAMEAVCKCTNYFIGNLPTMINKDDACKALSKLPSVGAVEVVRCKDCKYQDKGENESESWNVCKYRPWLYFSIDDDDYCSCGERKDG